MPKFFNRTYGSHLISRLEYGPNFPICSQPKFVSYAAMYKTNCKTFLEVIFFHQMFFCFMYLLVHQKVILWCLNRVSSLIYSEVCSDLDVNELEQGCKTIRLFCNYEYVNAG